MVHKEIGKIEKVTITNVWPHEANNFTPWLADNRIAW